MTIDTFTITILEDGMIRSVTDAVSAPNHDNCEQFLAAMAKLASGETTREARTDTPHHHHHADHTITKSPNFTIIKGR